MKEDAIFADRVSVGYFSRDQEALNAQALLNAAGRHDLSAVLEALDRLESEEEEDDEIVERDKFFERDKFLRTADSDGNTLLHRCVLGPDECSEASTDPELDDCLRIVELLVHARANVDSENMLGETPLVSAVRAASPHGVVRALLVARADPSCRDMLTGETALMEAACSGDTQLCKMLLEFKADPAQQNAQGLTAVDLALAAGSSSVAELPGMMVVAETSPTEMLDQKGPEDLRAAVKAGDLHGVESALQDLGFSVSSVLRTTDGSGRTILHLCVLNLGACDTPAIVQALARYSMQLDAEDAFGRTALEVAVDTSCSGQVEAQVGLATIRALLELRANPSAITNWCTEGTSLHSVATTSCGAAICKLLKDFGADVGSMTPLSATDKASEIPNSDELASDDSEVTNCITLEKRGQGASNDNQSSAGEKAAVVQSPPMATAPRRAGGLKQRCEACGIPFDILGTFSAADVLRECERLQALTLDELIQECQGSLVQDECRRLQAQGLPEQRLTARLLSRLQQVRIWKMMPMAALQLECRSHAAHVVDTSSLNAGEALEREDMIDALIVALWGGSTKNQQLMDKCAEKGIPVDKLESIERTALLLEMIQNLDKTSLLDLRHTYKKRGFVPSPDMKKGELVAKMTEVLIWEELPLSALRDVCKERSLPVRGDHRRSDLMRLLSAPTWEAQGIPILRLPSLVVAQEILEQVEQFRFRSVVDLRAECRDRELPFWPMGNKKDLLACLTAVLTWEAFSDDELYAACMERGVDVVDTNADRNMMLTGLGESLFQCLLEARGIKEQQLGREKAEELFQKVGIIESLDFAALQEEYGKCGMPVEAGIEKDECVRRVSRMIVWNSLTMEDVRKECRASEVATSGLNLRKGEDAQRRELLERLFLNLVRAAWEADDIPVKRLGISNLKAAARVMEQKQRLRQMSREGLCKEYEHLGLAADGKLTHPELRRHLTNVCIWKELPMKELQKEARNLDVSTYGMSHRSEEEQRSELVERLIVGMCLEAWEAKGIPVKRFCTVQAASKVVGRVQQLEDMNDQDLAKEYYAIGLPKSASKDPSPEQMLSRLKLIARWQALSLKELRKECSDSGVPNVILSTKMSEEEQEAELVDRLIMSSCADAWAKRGIPMHRFSNIPTTIRVVREVDRLRSLNYEELSAEYEKLGLPGEVGVPEDLAELEERLRLIAFWREFPLRELHKDCQKHDVSTTGASSNNLTDAEMRSELTERLILVTCCDGLEAKGIPIKKIRTIKATRALVQEVTRLEELSAEEAKEEYLKLELPMEVEMPEHDDELLSRLKQVAVWRNLPLHELRKKCQEFGVSGVGDEHPEMVQRVVCAAWLPRRPPSPRGGGAGQQRRAGKTSWDSQWDFRSGGAPGGKGGQQRHQWSHLFTPKDRAANMSQHFKTMGLSTNANADDLKKAYRNLALKYHPDKNVGLTQEEAAKKFREVKEAHEALTDYMKNRGQAKRP